MNTKVQQLIQGRKSRRISRVRAKVSGTAARPRLAMHRSLRYLSAQLIDDTAGKTLVSVHQKELGKAMKPVQAASELGKLLADKAKKAGIDAVVFDRRHFRYHGRIKAFADAAREGGLQF